MRIYPDYNEIEKASKQGNVIQIYTKILADVETPISAYLKLAKDEEYSFLLESISGEDKFARYTFLGVNPSIKISATDDNVEIIEHEKTTEFKLKTGENPLDYLKNIMSKYKMVKNEKLPSFVGGAVGYFGYDTVKYFEKIEKKNRAEINVPDMYFMITDTILAFDRFKQELLIICNMFIEEDRDLKSIYDESVEKIKNIYEKLTNEVKLNFQISEVKEEIKISSNFKKEEFYKAVESSKEYIKSGDIFQVVLSQRFMAEYKHNPFDVYRRLRSINPSPYMFYLNFKDFKIAGASPEILVKLEGDTITLRPIAGTRKRGKDVEEDIALEKELLSDEKEIAEHIMLVDLGRNDVGKISKYGTVKVTEKMVIERYSHVMHIVSSVQGKIEEDKDGFDLLQAVFPAGTLTGAPKIRAMEIIEDLEPVKREIYGGAIGYFSFNGDLDSCITIRTMVFKDNKAFMQAGAGIVYDSIPENEYKETENKIAPVIRALG
ncbi:anthranilate synthase component I [Haliovirga abyssi]|uniref:Anthranilate synthase component 1 n=1 Tax=Haliovirga abyssi TaxID=2996794 RepID=A0AAU9DAP0_9FUSO|nr:anthranilate synthase component I [Haliovirga abyssi]BDU50395.1 anthranilate synthase component I [Haliovirga abyssi]